MRVAVLKGGRSLEREVSLRSGANAEAALRRLGHDVLEVDVDQHLALAAEESAASARLAADLDATNALAWDAMRDRLAKRKAQRASRRSSLSPV